MSLAPTSLTLSLTRRALSRSPLRPTHTKRPLRHAALRRRLCRASPRPRAAAHRRCAAVHHALPPAAAANMGAVASAAWQLAGRLRLGGIRCRCGCRCACGRGEPPPADRREPLGSRAWGSRALGSREWGCTPLRTDDEKEPGAVGMLWSAEYVVTPSLPSQTGRAAPLGGHAGWSLARAAAPPDRLGPGSARPVCRRRSEQHAVHTVLVCMADEHDPLLEAAAKQRPGDEERTHLHGCGGQSRRRQCK